MNNLCVCFLFYFFNVDFFIILQASSKLRFNRWRGCLQSFISAEKRCRVMCPLLSILKLGKNSALSLSSFNPQTKHTTHSFVCTQRKEITNGMAKFDNREKPKWIYK